MIKHTSNRIFAGIAVCLLLPFSLAPSLRAAELAATDKQFLTNYEKVRAALADDDMKQAKAAAVKMSEEGSAIASSDNIKTAREGFAKLSERAVKVAKGQSGYYVAYCPMVNKEWVQTSKTISNPYGGKEMLTCGEIKE